MKQVGLTGNAGSGKSEVARVWREAGVPVIDADQLARDAVAPGTEGLAAVRAAFGDGFLAADGSLDRHRLRRHIFADSEARRRLEAILHPRIAQLRDERVKALEEGGAPLVVSEIPLLYEAGLEDRFDAVVLVDAPREACIRRIVDGRGLSPEEAEALLAAQLPAREKRDRADLIIANAGTLDELRERSLEVLDLLRAGGGGSTMKVDLHLHTAGSYDCLSDPEEVLAAAESRGVHRIAITDHNELSVALEMYRRYPERVIPGEEVRTAEGVDVIGLYLEEVIPKGTPAIETCARIREQGGIPYLPHPYAKGKGGGGALADMLAPHVDVVEVFNGRMHPAARNRPALELAERFGRARGAGSDAHTLGEVGRCHVILPVHPNRPTALLAALSEGRIHGREASRLVHVASTWAKLRRRLGGS